MNKVQKLIVIPNKGKAKPKTQAITEILQAEITKGWRIVTTIVAPDGVVVVFEGIKWPTDHSMLPMY